MDIKQRDRIGQVTERLRNTARETDRDRQAEGNKLRTTHRET